MRKLKQTKGITLVALILTIVILLILAVVTIRSIQGEGIIAKAIGAREKYEGAADEEQGILDKYLKELQGISSGTSQDESSSEDGENIEEGDKSATSESCFEWGSDTPGEDGYNMIVGYNDNLKEYSNIEIPSRCMYIKYQAFLNCNNLENLFIPSTVSYIYGGAGAFDGCYNIKNIEVSPDNQNYSSDNGVLFNKDKTILIMFPRGNDATEYSIPNGVSELSYHCFIRCKNLTNITIPNSVTTISQGVFYECTNINNLVIPENVSIMDVYVFYEWKSNQTINCRASSEPSGWENNWNDNCDAKVVWGYTGE